MPIACIFQSAMSCNGAILNKKLVNVHKCLLLTDGEFISITGDCGIILKIYLMAAFTGETMEKMNFTTTTTNMQQMSLPNIWCIPCTYAANCGISSRKCSFCFRIGPPPSWHKMVQEMGCVDHVHNSIVGTNSYKIYLNFNMFLLLWCHVQSEVNKVVQEQGMGNLMKLLMLLVLQ
jgi:hypothetical protein